MPGIKGDEHKPRILTIQFLELNLFAREN